MLEFCYLYLMSQHCSYIGVFKPFDLQFAGNDGITVMVKVYIMIFIFNPSPDLFIIIIVVIIIIITFIVQKSLLGNIFACKYFSHLKIDQF